MAQTATETAMETETATKTALDAKNRAIRVHGIQSLMPTEAREVREVLAREVLARVPVMARIQTIQGPRIW